MTWSLTEKYTFKTPKRRLYVSTNITEVDKKHDKIEEETVRYAGICPQYIARAKIHARNFEFIVQEGFKQIKQASIDYCMHKFKEKPA